jgi:hypothetical protein
MKQKRQEHVALVLGKRMHTHVMSRNRLIAKKRANPSLKIGDLVMELPPASGPLCTNLKGPFLVVDLNVNENIAVLQTGGTANKAKRLFKRHTSHLIPFKDKSRLILLATVLGGRNW